MQVKLGEKGAMVIGTLCKDAEYKLLGSKAIPCTEMRIIVSRGQTKEETVFATVKAWRELATYSKNLERHDTILAIGTINTRGYQGKEYKELNAEWLQAQNMVQYAPAASPASSTEPPIPPMNLNEDDEDLPF